MKTCSQCGSSHNRKSQLCQPCYHYLRLHPEGWYKRPPKGAIHYAPNGDPICHICGGAYRKLGNHIRFNHKMKVNDYKDKYKLMHSVSLTNLQYQDTMRTYTKQHYDKVVTTNLLNAGVKTRFKQGQEVKGRGRHFKITYDNN